MTSPACCSAFPAYERRLRDRGRRRIFRRPDRARASNWPSRARSTIWCSSAWPSAPSRWRSRQRSRIPAAGYDPLLERAHARRAAGLRRKGVRIITNMGAANPLGRRRGPPARSRANSASRARGRRRDRRRRADADARRRPAADRSARARPRDLGERIISANAYLGAGADRRGAGRRRGRGDHRPGRRPRDVPGAADPRVRLGDGRLGPARPRHARRPSAGMRRPGHRRLFRRPRPQGRRRASPGSAFRSAKVARTGER